MKLALYGASDDGVVLERDGVVVEEYDTKDAHFDLSDAEGRGAWIELTFGFQGWLVRCGARKYGVELPWPIVIQNDRHGLRAHVVSDSEIHVRFVKHVMLHSA